jgi:hypothetical protein
MNMLMLEQEPPTFLHCVAFGGQNQKEVAELLLAHRAASVDGYFFCPASIPANKLSRLLSRVCCVFFLGFNTVGNVPDGFGQDGSCGSGVTATSRTRRNAIVGIQFDSSRQVGPLPDHSMLSY